jgi:hypothetical protein
VRRGGASDSKKNKPEVQRAAQGVRETHVVVNSVFLLNAAT